MMPPERLREANGPEMELDLRQQTKLNRNETDSLINIEKARVFKIS